MREQVINGVTRWVENIIDGIAPDNILFALVSTPIKRVVGQYIEDNLDYNIIKPCIVSRDGDIDARATISEVMEGLKNMRKKKAKVQGLNIEVGNGAVVIELPESNAIALLTDNLKKITLTEKDFLQLAEYINNQN
jgi:hypothetical protein